MLLCINLGELVSLLVPLQETLELLSLPCRRVYIGAETWDSQQCQRQSIALPELRQDRDVRAWFKRFEVCAKANEWIKKIEEVEAAANTSAGPHLGRI